MSNKAKRLTWPAASATAESAGRRERTEGALCRLFRVRRTLRTRLGLLTDRQRTRLETVFGDNEHVAVDVTWWAWQQIIAAYESTDHTRGKTLLTAVIDRLRSELLAGLEELATLGRTLHRRRDDVPAHFDHRAPTAPPRPSTVASKPCAATPSASATSSTARSDPCCTAGTSHSDSGRAP